MALRKPRAEITLLEACRVDRGLTIEYVAKQVGISEKTITRYELAQTLKPQGSGLEKLGMFYGVRASVLLADMRKFARDRERDDEPTAAAA